ncbi:MAG: NAD(P)/FAD-dependent oxidoreductase [Gemmatimonadaceae bacterium]|nr:NAD(P)/FAD-dependent oxidoreductase [Gemmatimonadaceae bacterium]
MKRSRVVIVGGGFGGIEAAKALRHAPVDVTLVDCSNHFTFQPLLYQVATGALAPSDIAVPIRWLLRSVRNVTVFASRVTGIDPDARAVRLANGKTLEYDYLILAAGSRHAYFGHDDWEPHAPGLKTLEDAVEIRNRFLQSFECAELAESASERDAWLTTVIVGGGPTGVELAGIMVLIARKALRRDFRRIDPASARFILVEGGPRLVPGFPAHLSARALDDLTALGVEVRLGASVTAVGDGEVRIGDEVLRARTVFWAAGNRGSSLSAAFPNCVDRASHLNVQPDLSLSGYPGIFVVGDQAAVTNPDGRPVPRVAQGAMQMGRRAARNIIADLRGEERRRFVYHTHGELAVIGRYRAIAEFPWFTFAGVPAWFLWLFVHILYLAGFRNRLSVLVQWGYAFFTWQRGVRLILRLKRDSSRDT